MNSDSKIGLYLNHRWFAVLILLLASWGLWEMSDAHFRWSGGQEKKPLKHNIYGDGAAYYSYLPKWFYADEDGYAFLRKVTNNYPGSRFDDNLGLAGGTAPGYNKYYTGTAVMIAPFFLTAHTIETFGSGNVDGYSTIYLCMVSIAAIFYWLVGTVAVYILLLRLKIPSIYALITVLIITFGTNLFHYVVYAPSYSHVYSFACVSVLLLIAQRWVFTNRLTHLLLLGFLIGLAFIIRPTNVLILLLVPFFFRKLSYLAKRLSILFSHRIQNILYFLTFLSLPLIIHFSNLSGINSYQGEGFDHLTDPYIYEVLFGVRRGIFFYAPSLILAPLGLIVLVKNNRNLFWGFILAFFAFTYIISSWWCWRYGGSFSMRPFVDIMALFAIPIAFLLVRIHYVLKIVVAVFIMGVIGLTQVYSYQFNHQIIHYDGMNWDQFQRVFLKTGVRFEWYPYFSYDELPAQYSSYKSIPFQKDSEFTPQYYFLNYALPDTSNEMFAAQILGKVELFSDDTKPMVRLSLYNDDTLVYHEPVFFGAFIPSLRRKTQLSLDLFPEIKRSTIDSIHIELPIQENDLKIYDLTLDLYRVK